MGDGVGVGDGVAVGEAVTLGCGLGDGDELGEAVGPPQADSRTTHPQAAARALMRNLAGLGAFLLNTLATPLIGNCCSIPAFQGRRLRTVGAAQPIRVRVPD